MKTVGWMPQHLRLPGHVSVSDFVTYAGWLKGLSWTAAAAAAVTHLGLIGLSNRSGDAIGSLSGGMQRRAAFAASVVHDPNLLILDEPMVGLDPEQRSHLSSLIRHYGETVCVVLSTHLLDDLPDLANHILVLFDGTVRFDGDYQSFTRNAAGRDARAAYFQVIDGIKPVPT